MSNQGQLQSKESDTLTDHLDSAAGSYLTHQAIIRLDRDMSFLGGGACSPMQAYAVFIHEYMHYIHNYSTIAGVYDFVAFLNMLRLFVQTVGQDGESRGSAALDYASQERYVNLTAWRQHLVGAVNAPFNMQLHRTGVQLTLEQTDRRTSLIRLWQDDVTLHQVYIKFRLSSASAPDESINVHLGSHILTESIAWEIEQLFHGGADFDVSAVRPPVFPYQMGRILFEQISGRSLSHAMLIKVGLLALQTSDPGDTYVTIAERFGASTGPETDAALLEQMTGESTVILASNLHAICEAMIDQAAAGWGERGEAGRGITAMAGWCKDFLRARRDNPFFDLDAITLDADMSAFQKFVETYPPCPIVQTPGIRDSRAEILIAPNRTVNPNDLGAAQGLLQFANSHFALSEIVPTQKARRGPCRFWGVCKVGFTKSGGNSCQNRPWESFQAADNQGCWYSHGMVSARGRPDLS